ncbi:MAG: DUF4426 domain-containing protein [Pseudomonadales bacterium]|nr:DUF4426 domain-containing protein [Pseudomonadales bacterium]MCP5183425.1 DUF4426 domain-containing protein [Pseudomonadales bacterium]
MKRLLVTLFALVCCCPAAAEQKETFDGIDVHYIVLPTTDLDADIAARYGIVRAPLTGFVNISMVVADGPFEALSGNVDVTVKDLLGNVVHLDMREISEPPARYYLGTFTYSNEETMRLRITVTLPDGRAHTFTHQQKMYREQ